MTAAENLLCQKLKESNITHMSQIISTLFESLANAVGAPAALLIVSFLPLAEARLALPLGISFGVSPFLSLTLSFIGSSLPAFIFLPALRLLFKSRKAVLKSKLSTAYDKKLTKLKRRAEKKTASYGVSEFDPNSRTTLMLLGSFVALPLPMTGVWSGCIIGALLGGKPIKAALSITIGNLIASCLVLVFSVILAPYVDIIVTVLTVAAIGTTIAMLMKIIFSKKHRK